MKLKLDDNGAVVVQDGKPVYVAEDGSDYVADVPSLVTNVGKLKQESRARREELDKVTERFKPVADIEDLPGFLEQANKALTTVQNLDDKKLVDAGKVDELKAAMKEASEKEVQRVKGVYEEQLAERDNKLSEAEKTIYKLTVGNAFAKSPHFVGDNKLTILPPDAGEKLFGEYFTVRQGKDGRPLVVGVYPDPATGEMQEILSRKPDTMGEPAPFEEALAYILDKYPHKDAILAAGHPGSGGKGGDGQQGGDKGDKLKQLQAAYAKAQEAGDTRRAIALKNQIFKLQQSGKAA